MRTQTRMHRKQIVSVSAHQSVNVHQCPWNANRGRDGHPVHLFASAYAGSGFGDNESTTSTLRGALRIPSTFPLRPHLLSTVWAMASMCPAAEVGQFCSSFHEHWDDDRNTTYALCKAANPWSTWECLTDNVMTIRLNWFLLRVGGCY